MVEWKKYFSEKPALFYYCTIFYEIVILFSGEKGAETGELL